MSGTNVAIEQATGTTAGEFARVADILPPAVKVAAMPKRNDNSPQGRLEYIIEQALFRIDAKISARENPPHDFFKASVVLGELRGELNDYRSAQLKKGEYAVLTQLIANEIKVIDDCLRGACISQAKGVLAAYQESFSVAKPGVAINHSQLTANI